MTTNITVGLDGGTSLQLPDADTVDLASMEVSLKAEDGLLIFHGPTAKTLVPARHVRYLQIEEVPDAD